MSCVAWLDHFTHTIGSGEILHVVHQRRCAVLSCWGAPTQKKEVYFYYCYYTFFKKIYIKFKVALRPRLGLKPMVISVSNHGHVPVQTLLKTAKMTSYYGIADTQDAELRGLPRNLRECIIFSWIVFLHEL